MDTLFDAMADDVIPTIKRFVTDYRRGSTTAAELVGFVFHTLVDHNASEDIINQVLLLIPDSAIPTFANQMHEMVATDFFMPNRRLGDARSDDEIHRDAHARQPILRRIHHAFNRSLLVRRFRLEHGW